jgi:hypothetical protein
VSGRVKVVGVLGTTGIPRSTEVTESSVTVLPGGKPVWYGQELDEVMGLPRLRADVGDQRRSYG